MDKKQQKELYEVAIEKLKVFKDAVSMSEMEFRKIDLSYISIACGNLKQVIDETITDLSEALAEMEK